MIVNDCNVPHGTKFDTDKPRFDLIPPDSEKWIATVLAHGAKKYAPNNWTGLQVSRVIAAMRRHLNALESGEDIDPESGYPHHAHVATNAVFLSHLLDNYPEQDDRSFKHIRNNND